MHRVCDNCQAFLDPQERCNCLDDITVPANPPEEKIQIKACPCCAFQAKLKIDNITRPKGFTDNYTRILYHVICSSCGLQTPSLQSKEAVAKIWNYRF